MNEFDATKDRIKIMVLEKITLMVLVNAYSLKVTIDAAMVDRIATEAMIIPKEKDDIEPYIINRLTELMIDQCEDYKKEFGNGLESIEF